MRIQKVYVGYCAVSWFSWLLVSILDFTNGNAYGYINETVYLFSCAFSHFWVIAGLIPIHPILLIAGSVQVSKHRHKKYILFNFISFFVTAFGYFLLLVHHCALWGI